jgi:hypothetical protein
LTSGVSGKFDKKSLTKDQISILKYPKKRLQIRTKDRLFWIMLCRFWSNWQQPLIIVKSETVLRWHRKGFKLFWKFKSRSKGPGRPPISPMIRALILKMAKANPLWGVPRNHGELFKLGIEISERTVSNLMPSRLTTPPSCIPGNRAMGAVMFEKFVSAHEMGDNYGCAFFGHPRHFLQRFELVCKVRKSRKANNGVAQPGGQGNSHCAGLKAKKV